MNKQLLALTLIGATSLAGAGVAFAQSSDAGATTGARMQMERPFARQGMPKPPMEVKVEKIDGGIIMTRMSTDPAVVTRMQERLASEPSPTDHHPDWKDVTVKRESIDGGVRVTITSTDAATVTAIQAGPGAHAEQRGRGHGQRGDRMLMEGVDISVENVENGVLVRHTSTDPEKVKALQAHFAERAAKQKAAE